MEEQLRLDALEYHSVGSSLSARVPDTALRYVLAATLIVVGCKFAVDVFVQPTASIGVVRVAPTSKSGAQWRSEDRMLPTQDRGRTPPRISGQPADPPKWDSLQ